MRIECFLVCWNESAIMPLVIKHYAKFCDKITILDNYSTDGSDKLAESLGCEVIKFGTKFFDDENNRQIKNECWRGSDADLVICADFDEILCPPIPFNPNQCWHSAFRYFLKVHHHTTIWKTVGWQIMSDQMPKDDLLEVTNGFEFSNYAKNIIFNPKEITAINFNPGSHRIDPKGNVVYSEEPLYVLHYKHIGGVQRTIDRYREYKPRMSKLNRRKGWGSHYDRTEQSIREEWNERMAKSKPLT